MCPASAAAPAPVTRHAALVTTHPAVDRLASHQAPGLSPEAALGPGQHPLQLP